MTTPRGRFTRLGAAAAALALIASGCGGDDGTDGGTGTADLPDLTGETLEVAAVWTGAEQKTFEKVMAGFEEATGASFNYTSTGDEIATVLGTRVEGGKPPDIAILPQPGLLQQFAESGDLKPVSEDVGAAVDENYPAIWRNLATSGDQLYGVWVDASNKSTVWYNTNQFTQAGVEPPETWEDFLANAQTLSDAGIPVPVAIGGADGWTLTDWFENVYLRSAGPEAYDQLATHEIPWTDESVVTALETLAQLWGDPTLIGEPQDALQAAFTDSVTQVFSDDPTSAIVYEASFVAGVITDTSDFTIGQDAKWFPFPSIDDSEAAGVVTGGDVAVTFTGSKAAMAFLQYLASPDAAADMVSTGSFTSPNQNLDPSAYPDENSRALGQAIVDAGEDARFDMSDLAPSAFGGTPGAGEWKILQDFLEDPSDPAGTAAELERAAAKAFDQ